MTKHGFRHRRRALFYEKNQIDDTVTCTLCPRFCLLESGMVGACGARGNRKGVLYSLNYGWIRALTMDAVERIPLVEYYPSMNFLSVGSWGCNLRCTTCRDAHLIDEPGTGRVLYPDELAQVAAKLRNKDCVGVAYTFGEPSVWYEYVLDACKSAKRYDLRNVLSTNGCLNGKPLRYLLPHLDAVNLDIKTMDPAQYETLGGSLETVLQSARIIREADVHLEISRVLIPGVNDSEKDVTALIRFISQELGRDVPLHFLEHIPNGRTAYIRTPESDLIWAADLADAHLNNVYIGTP